MENTRAHAQPSVCGNKMASNNAMTETPIKVEYTDAAEGGKAVVRALLAVDGVGITFGKSRHKVDAKIFKVFGDLKPHAAVIARLGIVLTTASVTELNEAIDWFESKIGDCTEHEARKFRETNIMIHPDGRFLPFLTVKALGEETVIHLDTDARVLQFRKPCGESDHHAVVLIDHNFIFVPSKIMKNGAFSVNDNSLRILHPVPVRHFVPKPPPAGTRLGIIADEVWDWVQASVALDIQLTTIQLNDKSIFSINDGYIMTNSDVDGATIYAARACDM